MKRLALLSCFYLLGIAAIAQSCPQASKDGSGKPSETVALRGQLIYHDGIRKWFELKLDHPACGQKSIQITFEEKNRRSAEVLRGCEVVSTGPMAESPTGYYSLDLFQEDPRIEPIGYCAKQEPFEEVLASEPEPAIQTYQVEMLVDYEPGDHPIVFRVTSKGKELEPWQAYASYFFTGGFVLYGNCGKGFVVDRVFGTAEASPSHFTERGDGSDQAVFDPESAANAGKKKMSLKFTCVRKP